MKLTASNQMQARGISSRVKAAAGPRPVAIAVALEPHGSSPVDVAIRAAAAICASSLILSLYQPPASWAASGPPETVEAKESRCRLSAFDKFASTRAKFSMVRMNLVFHALSSPSQASHSRSQEASGGGMQEATVDVRGCDFKGSVLDGKVLSGVLMSGANCDQCSIKRSEAARADLRSASFQDVSFEDSNLFGTQFGGADLRGARFDNAILGNALFGKDSNGEWANLVGTHFEGALLSSSDIERLCANPTLDLDVRKFELGCRSGR